MSKNKTNKSNNKNKVTTATTTKVENKNTVDTTTKVENKVKEEKPTAQVKPQEKPQEKTKSQEQPKTQPKAQPKTQPTAKVEKPAESAEGAATVNVEVVKETKTKNPALPLTADEFYETMTEADKMDANHAAVFMDTLERRVSKMDKSKPLTVKMESVLDYNLMWYAIRLSVQSFAQKRSLNMITPNDEAIVNDAISIASTMGVALEAHPLNNRQMMLEFKEENMAQETIEAAKAENKAAEEEKKSIASKRKHDTLTEEEMDPKNWKTDDDAKRALQQLVVATRITPANKFLSMLNKIKTYRESSTEDPVLKNVWKDATIGSLTEELIKLMGQRSMIVLSGLMSATTNSMRLGQTMIFAHSIMKKNMPSLSDSEIAELVKTFIKIKHDKQDQPLDQDPAVVKGILEPTRDLFVRIATKNPVDQSDMDWYKKILNPLREVYQSEIGSPVTQEGTDNNQFYLNCANKMIEIRNLYVDKDAAFPLFTSNDFETIKGTFKVA